MARPARPCGATCRSISNIRGARPTTRPQGQPITFEFALHVADPKESMCFSFQVVDDIQQPICHFWLFDEEPYRFRPGMFMLRCRVPKFRLYMGSYTLTTFLSERRGNTAIETLTN